MLLAPGIESCDLGFLDLMNPVNVNSSLNQGLVSRWQVVSGLEGTKFWYDLAGRNHGTLTNGPTWDGTRGRPGGVGSLRFDGSNDYVNYGSVAQFQFTATQAYTLAGWIFPTAAALQTIISYAQSGGYGWYLVYDGSGLVTNQGILSDYYGPSGTYRRVQTAAGSVPLNAWCHVAITVDGSNTPSGMTAYINGKDASSLKTGGSPVNVVYTGTNFQIAARGSGGVFSGQIDDARIWSRAISAAEVKAVYDDSRAGSPQTLNWISPYYVPRQLTAQEPVPGDVYGLFGGGDFTGIQMGVPPEAIAAVGGYQGLLDFIGIPYGLPSQITPSAGNQAAARRRFYRHVVMHQTYRSILDHSRMTEVAHLALVNRIANQWNEYQAQLARSREIAIFATLLSEV